nr:hypothetical protein [Ruficoccus amylovorans]
MLLDAEDIVTAYIGVKSRGGRGALVDVSWAESLGHRACLHNNNFLIDKGHRDEVIGKRFYGFGDSFLPGADANSSEYLRVPWWRAGRYLLVRVRTADEPLTLEGLVCERTRYPLPARLRGGFAAPGDAELNAVLVLCERGLRNSCHETYSDCPAFEQLMYAGDTRVEILVHRVVDTDDRLARKAVQLFNDSRHGGKGWSWSRYPARLGQVIPGFCLLWVLMVDDFRLWRDDPDFVRDQLVGVRGVLDVFESCLGDDGWLQNLPGWQFIDWSPVWANGVPSADAQGRSTPVQLLYVLALQAGARIESEIGSELRAAHLLRLAQRAGEAVRADCWDARKGLFRDAPGREAFSEHSQVLAVLGLMDTAVNKGRLLENLRATVAQGRSELAPVSYYFSHYFFEACAAVGSDWLHERLQPWRELLARGLRTPIEGPEPNRSDCHGWSAHPLFHAAASIAGIRPDSSGFASVRIAPLPGPIPQLSCRLPWRAKSKGGGDIELDLTFADGGVCGRICLPDGLDGVFQWAGEDTPLVGGVNEIRRESVVLR